MLSVRYFTIYRVDLKPMVLTDSTPTCMHF